MENPENEAISNLADFYGKTGIEMAEFYQGDIQEAFGAGHGTTFHKDLGRIQRRREEEKHNAPIIALTDAFIDTTAVRYEWPTGSGIKIDGKLPPATYMMCFDEGVKYLKEHYSEIDADGDFLGVEKNIQVYNLSKEDRFHKKTI